MKTSVAGLLLLALLVGGCQGISGVEAAEAIEDEWIEQVALNVEAVKDGLTQVWESTARHLSNQMSYAEAADEVVMGATTIGVMQLSLDDMPVPTSGSYREADRALQEVYDEVNIYAQRAISCLDTLDGPTCHAVYDFPDDLYVRMDSIVYDLESGEYDS